MAAGLVKMSKLCRTVYRFSRRQRLYISVSMYNRALSTGAAGIYSGRSKISFSALKTLCLAEGYVGCGFILTAPFICVILKVDYPVATIVLPQVPKRCR